MAFFVARLALLATVFCLSETVVLRHPRVKRSLSPGGLTGKAELNLDTFQKSALDQLKSAVISDIVNPNMKKDIYLVKFLRATNYVTFAAIAMVKKTLNWRKEVGLDRKSKKDNSEGIKKLEASTTEVDVQGRVVQYMEVGKWGLAGISHEEEELYANTMYGLFEESANKAIQSFESGKKNAQYNIVLDYEFWTTAQGGCPTCCTLVGKVSGNYGIYWPGFAHKILLINTADDFKLFMNLIRPLLTKDVNDKLEVFGRNRAEWCPQVKKLMDHSQLEQYCSP